MIMSGAVTSLVLAACLVAAPIPKADPTRDRNGYPLPAGAVARLGSLTLRGPTTHGVTFSADGKTLLAADGANIYFWDAVTGRPLPARPAPPRDTDARYFDSLVAGPRLVRLAFRHGLPPKQEVLVSLVADGKQEVRFEADGRGAFDIRSLQLGPAAVSANGLYLAVRDDRGGSVSVYDLTTGKRLQTHKIERAYWTGVYISPDGKTLFASDAAKPVIRRWEVPTGKELPALKCDGGRVNMIEVSADGRRAVTRGQAPFKEPDGRVSGVVDEDFLTVWDLTAGKPTSRLAVGGRPWHFRFAGPDAVIVGTWTPDPPAPGTAALSRWDLTRGRREWEVPAPYSYCWLAVSPDGKRFAVSNRQYILRLFDAATGKPTVPAGAHDEHIAHVAFSADGKTVTTIGEQEVRTWAVDGVPKAVAAPVELRRGRFLPDPFAGPFVWITYGKGNKPEVVAWDSDKASVGWRFRWDGGAIEHILTTDRGQVAVVVRDGEAKMTRTVVVYDGPSGKKQHEWPLTEPPGEANGWSPVVALSPAGMLIQVTRTKIVRRRLADGKEADGIDATPPERVSVGMPFPIAVSADGARMAIVESRHVRVVDVKSGKALVDDRGAEQVYGGRAVFSRDGKRVAVWSYWGTGVRVYDVGSNGGPKVCDSGGPAGPTAAAFSPDGSRLAVGYRDGTALVWDLTGK